MYVYSYEVCHSLTGLQFKLVIHQMVDISHFGRRATRVLLQNTALDKQLTHLSLHSFIILLATSYSYLVKTE